jgi:hypothetical protein
MKTLLQCKERPHSGTLGARTGARTGARARLRKNLPIRQCGSDGHRRNGPFDPGAVHVGQGAAMALRAGATETSTTANRQRRLVSRSSTFGGRLRILRTNPAWPNGMSEVARIACRTRESRDATSNCSPSCPAAAIRHDAACRSHGQPDCPACLEIRDGGPLTQLAGDCAVRDRCPAPPCLSPIHSSTPLRFPSFC